MKISAVLATLLVTLSGSAIAGPVFSASSLTASQSFADALTSTTMTIAYDGSTYWSSSGGSADTDRLASYDAHGTLMATYAPGLDFRSVFTSGSTVLARAFGSNTIYQQTAPGVFTSKLTLNGGYLYAQSSVVKDSQNYIAFLNGAVTQWDASGSYLGAVSLLGYGSQGAELDYPQTRGIAVAGNYWLTYSSGQLSAWDHAGNRVDQTTLVGSGAGFDNNFSLSYANNKVFVVDTSGGTWRGYEVSPVPEPASYAMLLGGLALLGAAARRRAL